MENKTVHPKKRGTNTQSRKVDFHESFILGLLEVETLNKDEELVHRVMELVPPVVY